MVRTENNHSHLSEQLIGSHQHVHGGEIVRRFLSSTAKAGLTKLKVESLKVSTLVAIVRPFFLSSTATAGLTIDLGGVTSLHTFYNLVWFGWLVGCFPLVVNTSLSRSGSQ